MQITMDKQAVKASFSKAAVHYDQFADLQREIGHHLIQLTDHSQTNPVNQSGSVLDLGCGTGYFSALLNDFFGKNTQLTCFDLSPKMLQQASLRYLQNTKFVEGDIDALPFTISQFDLIYSNLVMQWSEHLQQSLKQIKQIMNPDGRLYFSTLLDGSLIELQQAWKAVDALPHINDFLTEMQVKQALKEAGFTRFTVSTETRVKKFNDIVSVMKTLKGIGASHVHHGNKARMSGRQLLQQLELGYAPYKDARGYYNLSYQVCYVLAFQDNKYV